MSQATYLIGDTRDVTATMPDDSVDLVLTSPPFLALRSYLPADHPDKHREIGSEPGPAEFIDTLLELTAEWGRVLAPHGSIAVELGDTYSGARGYGTEGSANPAYGERAETRLAEASVTKRFKKKDDGWPDAKSLCLIPELYRVALAYGTNPLNGKPSPAGRWRVRNNITWVRPNPPVGALGDKFRPATSDMVIACKSKDRWFDLDAVRQPLAEKTLTVKDGTPPSAKNMESPTASHKMTRLNNEAGAPPLDWWKISPGGYSGSHYAVFPPELCVKPIQAMCPREVCTECGEPRRRIVERNPDATAENLIKRDGRARDGAEDGPRPGGFSRVDNTTLGWTECDCSAPHRPGIVFDPFAGSGTALMVATGHGRDAVGIDIDERNADLARERIGMFLAVEDRRKAAA